MCSNTVIRFQSPPMIGRRIYSNPQTRIMYVLALLLLPPLWVLLSFPLGVVYYWGWLGVIGAVILIIVCGFSTLSFVAFTSVEIDSGEVVLRAPFWRWRIRASEVEWVELNPPINTLSLGWSWWERDSQCIIYRRARFKINASFMPDGLKRRIAQTLDPARWPPLPEPQQE